MKNSILCLIMGLFSILYIPDYKLAVAISTIFYLVSFYLIITEDK